MAKSMGMIHALRSLFDRGDVRCQRLRGVKKCQRVFRW
jgi:hypothetical protein